MENPTPVAGWREITEPRLSRPNTLAGLIAKRDELVRYRDQLEADAKAVTCDIDHLEAAILAPRHLGCVRQFNSQAS